MNYVLEVLILCVYLFHLSYEEDIYYIYSKKETGFELFYYDSSFKDKKPLKLESYSSKTIQNLLVIYVYISIQEPNDEKVVDFKYVRTCKENNENTYQLNLSVRKYNRTHCGVGMNITVPEPFDHTYELEFEMRLWSDGGWKKNFIHVKRKNACNTLYMLLGNIWASVVKAAHCNLGCPAKPGFYYFDNMYFDTSKSQLLLQPGRFFLFSRILKNNIVPACLEMEVEVKGV